MLWEVQALLFEIHLECKVQKLWKNRIIPVAFMRSLELVKNTNNWKIKIYHRLIKIKACFLLRTIKYAYRFTYFTREIPNAFNSLYKLRNLKNCLFQAHYTFIFVCRALFSFMTSLETCQPFVAGNPFLTFPFSIFRVQMVQVLCVIWRILRVL